VNKARIIKAMLIPALIYFWVKTPAFRLEKKKFKPFEIINFSS